VAWSGQFSGYAARVPHTALIVVDMLQTYDFDAGEQLAESAAEVVEPLVDLIERARDDDDVVTIHVNDALGPWTSDRRKILEHALDGRHPELVEPFEPPDDGLFVVKARHSIFYGTPLDHILGQEGVKHLVLTGQATEQCVLYSALDAHIRHIPVTIPRDCVAHIHPELASAALRMMECNMGARICATGAEAPLDLQSR
jgi:nicotinamidase-related amidase